MEPWKQIIHNDCGLPVELCTCPNAKVIYNEETDGYIILDEDFE